MNRLGTYLAICLFVVSAFFCLCAVKPSDAQSATQGPPPSYIPEPTYPTPSIPEFTAELAGPPYTQPTTYILNDSSGQTEPQIGFTNAYTSVNVTIKNQPFTSFDTGFNGNAWLMYNIRIKNHQSTDNWTEVYSAYFLYLSNASNTATTELDVPIQGVRTLGPIAGSQIDIQVQAYIGTVHRKIWPTEGVIAPWFFDGQVSGWSNTQTVNIPANVPLSVPSSSPYSTLEPTMSPTSDGSSSSILIVVITISAVIALLAAVYLLSYMKRKKNA